MYSFAALLHPVNVHPIHDIVINGHRQRRGALGQQPHHFADLGHIHVAVVDVFPIHQDLTGDSCAVGQFQETVKGFQQGGLAAAGGTHDDRDLLFGNLDVDILQGLVLPIIGIQIFDLNMCIHCSFPLFDRVLAQA